MNKLNLLKYYIYIWVAYFSVSLLLPATRINGDPTLSYLLLIFFVIVSSIMCISALYFLKETPSRKIDIRRLSNLDQLINYAVVMAIISMVFIAYDRVCIQGIDYWKGVAFARE